MFVWLLFLWCFAAQAGEEAKPVPLDLADVPENLEPWLGWVLSKHPTLTCPRVGASVTCVWPGELELDVDTDGAAFQLSVTTDREIPVPLPGGDRMWPQNLQVNGRAAPSIDVGGVPTVLLPPGNHQVTGDIRWAAIPQSLPLPPHIARVSLTRQGAVIPRPRRSDDGTLRLGAGDDEARDENRLDVEVFRRIADGVPVHVTTRITLRAAGAAREISLGDVRIKGTDVVSLTADVPARFSADGELVAQVRPGTWTVTFDAVHEGPVSTLSAPAKELPWPAQEVWVVATDDRIRAVNLTGPAGVDAGRTNLPQDADWRGLPTWMVSPDTPLAFEELRRGEPSPPPNQLSLDREIWLDLNGEGLTVRDRFTGTMNLGWRLDVLPPTALGHVSDQSVDQVITEVTEGAAGVELRRQQVNLVAESRIEGRPTELPAVGWDTDVHRLSGKIHLPPGWRLLTATGVDNLDGSVLDQWTLFDLFFVLVLALSIGKLLGPRWGFVALLGMALARHEANAPAWTWVLVVVAEATWRAAPVGWIKTSMAVAKWALVGLLLLLLIPFSILQVRNHAFPSLDQPHSVSAWDGNQDVFLSSESGEWAANEISKPSTRSSKKRGRFDYQGKSYLSSQIDPNAVVQTGPGVPSWEWKTQPLSWSGPVSVDHRMKLFLLGPQLNLLLAVLRVLLLLGLAIRLCQVRKWFTPTLARAVGAALVATIVMPTAASAQTPSPQLLTELEQRLTQPPICTPNCITTTSVGLEVADNSLRISADVSAAAMSAWPLPGPADVWQPPNVRIDGVTTTAIRRMGDGFFYVRLPAGRHEITADGPLPPTDAATIQWGLHPKFVSFSGDGWAIEGLRADGSAEGAVQLTRAMASAGSQPREGQHHLAPWVSVHRTLDLGMPWRVRTEVTRRGDVTQPLSLPIPLLQGEAVTDGTYEVDNGQIQITMGRDVTSATWLSTLDQVESLPLVAPTDVPWTERWTVSCSPIYHCTAEGPAPIHHVIEGGWMPEWLPWAGETISVRVNRPDAVSGQTTTVDSVTYTVNPGRRQLEGSLQLEVRTSQGATQVITLPEGARLMTVQIDNEAKPIQAREGNQVHIPLHPGKQTVNLTWTQTRPAQVMDQVPLVDIGSEAVNVTVRANLPSHRWIALISGPRWGPVPLFWVYVLVSLIAAPLVSRLPYARLKTWQWALLFLGMTQVPIICPIIVALWFALIAFREHHSLQNNELFNLFQLLLVGWSLITLVALYSAIHVGLLFDPDVQVMGNGSSNRALIWFVDRSASTLPQPSLVSFPRWVWSVLMLLWSLWLAASFTRWVPWAWRAFGNDGYIRSVTKATKKPPEPAVSAAEE
jgi:hypothetical protein